MKIHVFLKDPDGFSNSVDDAIRASIDEIEGLCDAEKEDLFETRRTEEWDKLDKFVKYNECTTIVFDTDKGTATVLKVE